MASTSREASSTGNLLANIKAWAGVLRIQKTRLRRMTCILYGKMKRVSQFMDTAFDREHHHTFVDR